MREVTPAIILIFVLAVATESFAQTGLGTLKGKIYDDQQRVIPGAKVTLVSDAIMGERTVKASGVGAYRFVNLPPGQYTIRVSANNYKKYEHSGITINSGKTTGLNITLYVGEFEDTIQIIGNEPLIDLTETGKKINISGDFHRSLPITVRSEITDVLKLIPGINQFEVPGLKLGIFSVHGTDDFEEKPNWSLDGAFAADFGLGYMNTRLNLDVIEETSIDITGVNSSNLVGRAGSIFIITKSGGNEVSGSLSLQFQPQSWNDSNVDDASPMDTRYYQVGATIGGPIIEDKLWYFGSFRYQQISEGIARTSENINNLNAIFPGFDPFRVEKKKPDLFGKISYRLNDYHDFFVSYQQEWGPETLGDPTYTESALTRWELYGYIFNSNWNWAIDDNKYLSTAMSYTYKPQRTTFEDETQTGRTYYQFAFPGSGGNLSGFTALAEDGLVQTNFHNSDKQFQIRSNLNWFLETGSGLHNVNIGAFFNPFNENVYTFQNSAAPWREELVAVNPVDLSQGFIPYKRTHRPLADVQLSTDKMKRYAGYFSDNWAVNDRLTLQFGLRFTDAQATDELSGVDYSSPWARAISPSIGFTYALSSDSKNIIRANYSRNFKNLLARVLPQSGRQQFMGGFQEWDNNLDGIFETVIQSPSGIREADIPDWSGIDLLGYSDDFSFGFSSELPKQILLNADYIFRRGGGGHLMAMNAIIENGIWLGPRVPGKQYYESQTPVNNTFNHTEFHGVDVSLSKSLSHNLQFLIGYSWADLKEKGEWGPDSPYAYLESPDSFENIAGIPHSIRFNIVYLAPWEISVGVSGQISSGRLSGAIWDLDFTNPDIFAHGAPVMFSNGVLVTNPLFTPQRLAFDNRSEGQWRGETTYNWNVRLEKSFSLQEKYSLSLAVDLFNVFNSGSRPADLRGTIRTLFPDLYGEFLDTSFQQPRAAQASLKLTF